MSTQVITKTPDEIAELKRNWAKDPCWDIEDTDGFEAHRDELLEYRLAIDAAYDRRRQAELQAKAIALGIPGNTALAAAILHLEQRVRDHERRIDELKVE